MTNQKMKTAKQRHLLEPAGESCATALQRARINNQSEPLKNSNHPIRSQESLAGCGLRRYRCRSCRLMRPTPPRLNINCNVDGRLSLQVNPCNIGPSRRGIAGGAEDEAIKFSLGCFPRASWSGLV